MYSVSKLAKLFSGKIDYSIFSRNIASSFKVFTGHSRIYDDKVEQKASKSKIQESQTQNEQIDFDKTDTKLINLVYRNENHEIGKLGHIDFNINSNSKSSDEYFKQAWISKLDVISKQSEKGSQSKKVSTKTEEEGNITFGTLHTLLEPGALKADLKYKYRNPNKRIAEQFPDDEDKVRDWRKNIPLTRYGRLGRKAFYYTKKMTKLGREGKVNEAMKVFDQWMMIDDRVLPSKRTFITLIGIVGRAGYTRKAFQLFRQMKGLGLDPPDHVYTSLFNACANCPIPEYGLKRANSLQQQMKEKGIPAGQITTLASMKAFALCGDFSKAFQILEEANIPLDVQSFNTLLIACAADKHSGTRRAIKVWQIMQEYNITPELKTYNLLIRCLRDSGVGDTKTLAADLGIPVSSESQTEILSLDMLQKSIPNDTLTFNQPSSLSFLKESGLKELIHLDTEQDVDFVGCSLLPLPEYGQKECIEKVVEEISIVPQQMAGDNADRFSHEHLIEEEESYRASDTDKEWWQDFEKSLQSAVWRFEHPQDLNLYTTAKTDGFSACSAEGTLRDLGTSSVSIDTLMNSSLSPVTTVSISEVSTKPGRLALVGGAFSILADMKSNRVEADTKFCSKLLSCLENDAESEAMLLRVMDAKGIAPDMDFFNDIMMRRNLRHESHSVKDVLPLVSKLRLTPNMRTYAALALTCHTYNDAIYLLEDMEAIGVEPTVEVMGHLIYISRLKFRNKKSLIQKMEDLALTPSPRIIQMIEKSLAIARRNIVNAEKNVGSGMQSSLNPRFQRDVTHFTKYYQAWLLRSEIPDSPHPWEKFTDNQDRIIQKSKDKNHSLRKESKNQVNV